MALYPFPHTQFPLHIPMDETALRVACPTDKTALRMARARHAVSVRTTADKNRAAGRRGVVTMQPEPVELIESAINVFPSSHTVADWSIDAELLGVSLPKLAPVGMGTVRYASWLPPASRLETLTACRLMYADDLAPGAPDAATRVLDLMAHDRVIVTKPALDGTVSARTPVCARVYTGPSCWRDIDLVRYRQFFCNYYAHLAEMSPDFDRITQLLDAGNNICIAGPTAGRVFVAEDVTKAYNDAATPFGHEWVLFGMLTGIEPWKAAIEPDLWEVPLAQSVPLFT